jgi:hypothetical protein
MSAPLTRPKCPTCHGAGWVLYNHNSAASDDWTKSQRLCPEDCAGARRVERDRADLGQRPMPRIEPAREWVAA